MSRALYPCLAVVQDVVHVPQPLLALVLHLLLHVRDALLQVLDLILVQLYQIVHLLFQALQHPNTLYQHHH